MGSPKESVEDVIASLIEGLKHFARLRQQFLRERVEAERLLRVVEAHHASMQSEVAAACLTPEEAALSQAKLVATQQCIDAVRHQHQACSAKWDALRRLPEYRIYVALAWFVGIAGGGRNRQPATTAGGHMAQQQEVALLRIERAFQIAELVVDPRLASEEVGDALEVIHATLRDGRSVWLAYAKTVATIVVLLINAARYRGATKKRGG